MEIKVFSDVFCTWSYGEEKVLRAIDFIYESNVKIVNIMGGMFSDYRDLLPINMKDQDSKEMANNIIWEMWKTGYNFHNMPIINHCPDLLSEDNVSVYPVDTAFVAARLTDEEKSNRYLRMLREYTLLDGKNTFDINIQVEIAEKCKIDKEKFLYNLNNYAHDEFLEDRMKSFDNRFVNFPDFEYRKRDGKVVLKKGYRNLDEMMEIIDNNSDIKKRDYSLNEKNIMDFITKYKRVFIPELNEVFKDKIKITEIVDNLFLNDFCEVNNVGNGIEIIKK